ncbi:MAG: PilW family protein [Nitrosomonas sp.]|nr:PilW family protein [Nitrosomonas sp.]
MMTILSAKTAYPRQQQGLTLVEIMVALTIGMVLLGGVITILVSSQQTYRVNEALARIQENARFAFQLLSRDIRMAGYMGCVGEGTVPVNTLNNATDYLWNFGQPIQGYEATASGWMPAPLPTEITSPLGGRDILILRGVDGPDTPVISHPAGGVDGPGSADLKVTVDSGLQDNDIVLVTDCLAAAIFQITNINTSAGQDNVVHNTGTGAPGNATKNLGQSFKDGEVVRISTRSYYVRTNSGGNAALYWKRGNAAAEELVEGVENMQIDYGVDTDGNRAADVYQTADLVVDWENVVSVRINLLMQSTEDNITSQPQTYTFNGTVTTPTDRRLRKTYSTVIALRNRAS